MLKGQVLRDIIESQGVETVDRGPNVKRGHFNIKCPMCGAGDPSHHMGINEDTGYWGCWRNAEHRGKSGVRLIVAITGLPVWRVRELLGIRESPDLEQFAKLRARLVGSDKAEDAPEAAQAVLKFPKQFRPLEDGPIAAGRFMRYMRSSSRKFGHASQRVCDMYDLHYAIAGEYADRVILPFHYQGMLVTWSGRSIHAEETLRYRDLDQESSLIFKNDVLFNYDNASHGGTALIVLEGQFDVLKADFAGAPYGVRAVGFSTNTYSDAQLAMLCELADGFEVTYLCLDTPTRFHVLDTKRMVAKMRAVLPIQPLDASALGKDFGGASIRDAAQLLKGVRDAAL